MIIQCFRNQISTRTDLDCIVASSFYSAQDVSSKTSRERLHVRTQIVPYIDGQMH